MAEAESNRWGHVEELLYANCALIDRLTHVIAGLLGGRSAVGSLKQFKYLRPGEKPRNVVRPGDLARRLLGKG